MFVCWWSFKPLSLCILCIKRSFNDTAPGSLPGVPSLFHIPNGFTVKHKRSTRILCQCDTNSAGHFTLDAHASRPVACYWNWKAISLKRYLHSRVVVSTNFSISNEYIAVHVTECAFYQFYSSIVVLNNNMCCHETARALEPLQHTTW